MRVRPPFSIAACFHAPILEIALLHHALTLFAPFAADDGSSDGGFHGPSLADFFPSVVLFAGTPFEINRVMLIRFFVVVVMVVVFWLGTRRLRVVPGRGQVALEFVVGFVQSAIIEGALGKKDGKRFAPLLTAMFFTIVSMNITGIVPGLNLAGTSVIGLPLVLAIISYGAFIYAGIRKHPASFLRNALFPPGVAWYLYIVVTPIEFLSTFILRPVTLTLRLLMNMVAGHMLLVLCFSATSFFLLETEGLFKAFSPFTLAFGFAFTLFDVLVAVLQAYVFTYLAAVYIQLALAEEH